MSFQIGESVLINVPENERLHVTRAVIRELVNWGAHLFAPAAATKQFRGSA